MTLTRLTLHNYMIHRDFSADFDGHLIALTGEMGHGKSTFVGAIQFCLTGEHPPWHRDDLLTWGETSGSAKLEFIQDGVPCTILRKLESTEATLTIGTDTVSGVRNVERALAERLGVDKDILKQIGFVQQYDIQAILFDDPGRRERAFQRLLGIGDANKIWTELGTLIQANSRTENFDAAIETLKLQIGRIGDELTAVDQSLETSRKALSLIPDSTDLNAELDRLTRVHTQVSMLDNMRGNLRTNQERLGELTARHAQLTAERTELTSKLKVPMDEWTAEIARMNEAMIAAKTAYENMRTLATASTEGGVCPLCGDAVQPGQIARHTADELKRLKDLYTEARSTYVINRDMQAALAKSLSVIDTDLEATAFNIKTVQTAVDAEKKREQWLLTEFARLGVTPEQFESPDLRDALTRRMQEIREALSQTTYLTRQIDLLQGSKNEKQRQLEQTKTLLEEKVREKELSAPRAARLEVLSHVRNWFHSSNGPRTMSLAAIRAMTGYVNEYLRALHSEIEVIPDNQGLSFAFTYVDGRPVSTPPPSTAKLSGGQKIGLALAFRLAIYRYFGQKMGIMVLDEPTAHLSPAGITHFGALLQDISTLAKNMNLQIVMPTHEQEILPYMDQEIRFS